AELAALSLAERLRDALPGLRLLVNSVGGSFKSQFKKADKSGARFALILGEDELAGRGVGCKPLRDDREQQSIAWDALPERLAACIEQAGDSAYGRSEIETSGTEEEQRAQMKEWWQRNSLTMLRGHVLAV